MKTEEQEPFKVKGDIAVLVGRFQVDDLHKCHRDMFDNLLARYNTVVTCLGISTVLGTKRNPVDYLTREKMIRTAYPNVIVLPLVDNRSDKVWSENLDNLVRMICPKGHIVMYGGRDSFIRCYTGQFQTVEVEMIDQISGTDIREKIGKEVRNSPDFRAGVIYGSQNQGPKITHVANVAITRKDGDKTKVLVGTKGFGFVFPGGHAEPTDNGLQGTVRREIVEETGIAIEGKLHFVCSVKVPDWRFRGTEDVTFATLFHGEYTFGGAAKGDLKEIMWIDVDELNEKNFDPDYKPLVEEFIKYIKENKNV